MASRTLLGFAQTVADSGSGTSMSSTTRTISAASLVLVVWRYEGGSAVATSVTDTAGATYSTPVEFGTEPTVGFAYKWSHPGQASNNATVNLSASRGFFVVKQIEFDGGDSSDPIDGSPVTVNGSSPSMGYTASTAGLAAAISGCFSAGAPAASSPAIDICANTYSAAYYRTHSSGSNTIAATAGAGNVNSIAIIFKDAVSVASEQEGARFGNDDAAEAAHTWAAAQDTNITAPAGQTQLLNMIVNATGTLGAKTFKLQYRKTGDGAWRDVPVQ